MALPELQRLFTILLMKCYLKKKQNLTLEGFEKGQESELGAVNVMTGVYTGRSPKDKFIVMDENSKDTVWWTSDEYKNDNHPATQEAWNCCKRAGSERTVQQETVRSRCILWCKQRHPYGYPFHRRSSMAGTFRN